MKQKIWNIFKAFMTGFIVVALVLLAMPFIAPLLGFGYEISWSFSFIFEKSTTPLIHVSWFAPLLVGVIFALVQFFDDFESHLSKHYRKVVKTKEMHELFVILWHGLWGLSLGFVISMFFLALIAGTEKTYIIPYLLDATAKGGSVSATTSVMTVFTILGLVWGAWKVNHLPKHKAAHKARKAKRKK